MGLRHTYDMTKNRGNYSKPHKKSGIDTACSDTRVFSKEIEHLYDSIGKSLQAYHTGRRHPNRSSIALNSIPFHTIRAHAIHYPGRNDDEGVCHHRVVMQIIQPMVHLCAIVHPNAIA